MIQQKSQKRQTTGFGPCVTFSKKAKKESVAKWKFWKIRCV